MNMYFRSSALIRIACAAFLGFALTSRAADITTWKDLNTAYHAWRPLYVPMVMPLNESIAQIEAEVLNGTYAFAADPRYYVDVSAGQWAFIAGGEVAAAVKDGQWVYAIEDITKGQVLILDENQNLLASFTAEPWPTMTGNYEATLLTELAKRRVVFWVQLKSEAAVQAEAQAEPAQSTQTTSGSSYTSMLDSGEGGDPANCDPCMLDLDGDGFPNRDEIIAGTDPNDATSFPAFTNFVWDGTSMTYYWHGVTNREYVLQTGPTNGFADAYAFTNVGAWLTGAGAGLSQTDSNSPTSQEFAVSRLLIRERDSNMNGIPDWWEIQQYGALTNINATGDDDNDGLENQEEYLYGYSPTNSERFLYHSAFHAVQVNTNDPIGADDGTEVFDFSGQGRPLSLASNAAYWGCAAIDGSPRNSGGIYFNNDTSNLYVGVSGIDLGGNNCLALFLDTDGPASGRTNLSNLSTSSPPFGLSRCRNLTFGGGFSPNVGLLLGARFADGKNYPNFTNRGARAWGMYAGSGGTSAAVRTFTALATGQTFTIEMDNGYLESGRQVGFELQDSSAANRFRFFYRGYDATDSYKVTDNSGERNLSPTLGYTEEGVRIAVTLLTADTYTATVTRLVDGATRNIGGTLSGSAGTGVSRVRLFDQDAGGAVGGPPYDAFFNNLSIKATGRDHASDRAYDSGLFNGQPSGTGFSAWNLSTSGPGGSYAGFYIGSSTTNGSHSDSNNDRDIDGASDYGEGVYQLSDGGDFPGFNTSGGCPISQWGTNQPDDGVSANDGAEVRFSLSSLGIAPGDTIKVAALFLGGSPDGSNQWIGAEVFGKSATLNTNWGYDLT